MSYVEIKGLAKRFGETPVFQDIDLGIAQGAICVLVGPSGCGKTTLLRAVAGLTSPDRGTIAVDGQDITQLPAKDRGIGMVFQHYALFPNMTVEQNLSFGLEQRKLPSSVILKKVKDMVALMGLEDRAKAPPSALSGGQKQRVALARALILEPKLLLLDEPLSALDAQIRKRLRDELKRLQHEVGFTAIFVTHDQEEALILGDVVAIMQHGRFAQVGAPAEIYNHPASLAVARFVGDFNIIEPSSAYKMFGEMPLQAWAIRPEAIGIGPSRSKASKANGAYHAEAIVVSVQVLGPMVRYAAKCGDDILKIDVLNKPDAAFLKAGHGAEITIARNGINELPK